MFNYGVKPEGWNNEISCINMDMMENYINKKETLQGKVQKCDKDYNLYVSLGNGIQGIIPREEIEAINVEENGVPKSNLSIGKVNKFVQFKVKDISDNNMVILSRKQVQEEALNTLKSNLKVGQNVKGIVKSIKQYGAFIEIGGGVVALVHIEDLSVARIKTPFERLQIGQTLDFVVKEIDNNTGRISLSYKEILGTWEENAKKFSVGMKTTGIVRETEKNKNGIFIELLPNLVGMAEYKENLEYGKTIDVLVKKIDYDKKKVKLAYYN